MATKYVTKLFAETELDKTTLLVLKKALPEESSTLYLDGEKVDDYNPTVPGELALVFLAYTCPQCEDL